MLKMAFGRTLLGVLLGLLALTPAIASAEPLCTDTWIGTGESTWQTPASWSTGKVPSSSDVACITKGHTAIVSEGTNRAGVILSDGGLAITGGSLEIANALEASRTLSFSLSGGSLLGVGP